MNWKLAGMASTALVTVALTGVSAVAGANKFTGNVSLAVGQSFEDDDLGIGPIDFRQLVHVDHRRREIQRRVLEQHQPAARLRGTWRLLDDSTGLLARSRRRLPRRGASLFAQRPLRGRPLRRAPAFLRVRTFFCWRGWPSTTSPASQGQYYWNNFTFGLDGGYLNSSRTDALRRVHGDDLFLNNAWFANAEVRWYATPKFALTANVGYISGEALFGFADVDTLHWGAKAEYWPEEKEPLSLWVAYEGRKTDCDFTPAGSSPTSTRTCTPSRSA